MNEETAHGSNRVLAMLLEKHREAMLDLIDKFINEQRSGLEDHRQCMKELADKQRLLLEASSVDDCTALLPTEHQPAVSMSSINIYDCTDDGCPVKGLPHKLRLLPSRSSVDESLTGIEASRASRATSQIQEEFTNLQSKQNHESLLCWIAYRLGCDHYLAGFIDALSRKRLPAKLSCHANAIMNSRSFVTATLLLIVLNSIFIIVTADDLMYRATERWKSAPSGEIPNRKLEGVPLWLHAWDVAFVVLFSLELLVRLAAEEGSFFINADHAKWNILDLVCVISAWLEVVLASMEVSFLRVFRVLRVIRSIRILRILRSLSDLRLTIVSLFASIAPLFWAVVCLCLLMHVFAIIIQQGVANFLIDAPGGQEATGQLIDTFERFTRTCLMLFVCITGGEDWFNVQQRLDKMGWEYGLFFVFYIAVMVLGVLNVINGIFVEGAIQKARLDCDLRSMEETKKTTTRIRQLMKLFRKLDANNDDNMTLQEWEDVVCKKEARALLALLDLDVHKVREIFTLIDVDGSGSVDIKEFVVGCMQLKSGSTTVDVETLLRSNRKLMHRVDSKIKLILKAVTDNFATVVNLMKSNQDELTAPKNRDSKMVRRRSSESDRKTNGFRKQKTNSTSALSEEIEYGLLD